MSLQRNVQKNHLKEEYERYRKQADKARDEGHNQKAARYYRECVDTLEDLVEVENSDPVAEKWTKLADNLASVADKLESGDFDNTEATDEDTGGSSSGGSAGGGSNSPPESSPPADDDEGSAVNKETVLQENPDTDFGDVGGMTDLKETLKDQVIDPLQRPELYEEYDLGVVNGVLLHGPPGTGKTHITTALAGELGYNFVEAQPSDMTSSLVGESADKISDLFQIARDNQPCLLFLDEIDAIAAERNDGANKTMSESQMITQFLTEMSDIKGEDIVVVGATNLPDEIDGAAWRRFDERIKVPPPDRQARAAVLRIYLRDRPVVTETIDWDEIKDLTEGYSSSDLEIIASKAARNALSQARSEDEIVPISQSHIETAIDDTESSLKAWDQ